MEPHSRTWTQTIIIAILTIALAQVFFTASLRWTEEKANDSVEIAVFLDEIVDFSAQHGVTARDLLVRLKSAGATTIIIGETSLDKLEKKGLASVFSGFPSFLQTGDGQPVALGLEGRTFRPGYTYVIPGSPDTADSIERALSARLGRDRVTRGEAYGKAVLEIRAVDRHVRLVYASGAEANPPGYVRSMPLGFSPDDISLAQGTGLRTLFEVYSDGVSDDRMVEFTLDPLQGFEPGTLCFNGSRSLGYPDHLGATEAAVARLASSGWKLGLVEFSNTRGVPGIAAAIPGSNLVRIHTMSQEEMIRLTIPKALARWVRAVKERGMRILAVRLDFGDSRYFQGRGLFSPVQENLDYIARICSLVRSKGYRIQPALSPPMGTSGPLAVLCLSLGVSAFSGVAAAVILGWRTGICVAFSSLLGIAGLVMFGLGKIMAMRKGFSLLAALAFPAMSAVVTFRSIPVGRTRFRASVSCAFWAWFRGFVVLLPGIFFIVGLMRHPAYGVKLEQFFGVKAALIGPLLLVGLHYLKREGLDFSVLKSPISVGHLAAALAMGACAALFILRSGNLQFVSTLGIEDLFRGTLEDLLFARPRTKELLIGFPCLFALALAVQREWKGIRLPLLLGSAILSVSMLNTFCHIHTPLQMSVLRTGNSILLGIPAGIVSSWLVLLAYTFYLSAGRDLVVGYYGFRNIGDEAILYTLASAMAEQPGGSTLAVLSEDPDWTENHCGIPSFSRSDSAEIIGAVLGSRNIVIGGGGLIQDSTGAFSPAYYCGIGLFGVLAGKNIIVFANGLGPLNNRLTKLLARALFGLATSISLRDRESVSLAESICPGVNYDLVYDPVLEMPWHPEATQHASVGTDASASKRLLAVVPRDLGKQGATALAQINAGILAFMEAEAGNSKMWEVKVLPFQPSDRQVAREICRCLNDEMTRRNEQRGLPPGQPAAVVVEPLDPVVALNELSGATLVLSVRLHGAIMAERTGVPWVSVDYDPKVTAFSMARQGKGGVDPWNDLDSMAARICGRLSALSESPEGPGSPERSGPLVAEGGDFSGNSPCKWLLAQFGAPRRS